jgi:hypothetical protein
MLKRILAIGTGSGSIASWFYREGLKAWFFDQVIHMTDPVLGYVVEFGPPLLLAGVTIWLLANGRSGFARGQNQKPQPNMRLEDVVKRITGLQRLPAAIEPGSTDIIDACELLREKALHDLIDVFGGIGWRATRPADYDRMIRDRIPSNYWRDHQLDVIGFLGGDDHRGRTCDLAGDSSGEDYYGIWFDKDQIDALWPAPKRRIDWRNPINWKQQ